MQFTTPPGGVLTNQVGAITGDVDARIAEDGTVRIRYLGAEEEYTVAGGRADTTLDVVVARLANDPGPDADGNPLATSLATQPVPDDGFIDDEPERLGDQLL
ncbi:hypothetical protein [Luteococcus peritonei]|uniref:Uncharacterized protein n=1 Tax=Luteococcus peritonei TaxID=88874 RepID=A0ABW4RTP6_9ACTN